MSEWMVHLVQRLQDTHQELHNHHGQHRAGLSRPSPQTPRSKRSPGQVSLDLTVIRSETLGPAQINLDLNTTIGSQSTENLAEVCTVNLMQVELPHTLTEPLEQDFLERKSRSTSSLLDSSLELNSQMCLQDKILLDQMELPEPPEAEPQREEDWCGCVGLRL
ncbi:hypothetical protein H920_03080 [Fukomys damarensis]|uniref:Uncharacterized protein n=1 Tax=Fukomys damarensis TaxID=885580 RepID=A0A091DYY6_FUKDA|nr:hypothetical protein H920_03080 [Fukomys damarensis]